LAGHQYETRRAEPALRGTALQEGLLHRTELAVGRKVLDRRHLFAVDEGRKIEATGDGAAIDQDCAAAAETLRATLARAEQIKPLAQDLDDGLVHTDFGARLLAVEGETNGAAHLSPPAARRGRHRARGRRSQQ